MSFSSDKYISVVHYISRLVLYTYILIFPCYCVKKNFPDGPYITNNVQSENQIVQNRKTKCEFSQIFRKKQNVNLSRF